MTDPAGSSPAPRPFQTGGSAERSTAASDRPPEKSAGTSTPPSPALEGQRDAARTSERHGPAATAEGHDPPGLASDGPGVSGSPPAAPSRATGGPAGLWPLFGAVLLLALFPRLQRLRDVSFWFDEAFSRKMVSFGFVEIWDRTARDVHPPLYYWLLKLWAGMFGDSPEALRSMSVFCGLLTVLGVFLLVREAERGPHADGGVRLSSGDGAALLAAALVALSPFQIAWSLQARMYTLGTALTAFSTLLLLRALRPGPPRPAVWAGYVALAVALTYTHIFGLFIVAAQGVFAAAVGLRRGWSSKPSGRWNTLAAAFVAFFAVEALWLPWAGEFFDQKARVAATYWIPPFRWERPLEVAYQFFAVSERDLPASPAIAYAAAEFCFALTAALLLFGRPGHRMIALGFGVSVAAALPVSYFLQNVFVTHYFLFAHVFLLCGIAAAAARAPTRPGRALVSAAVLLAASALCWRHVEARERRAAVPGLKAAMSYLDDVRRRGEPVLTGNPMLHAAVLAHVGDRSRVYVVHGGRDFPHFQGTPVMRETEYLDAGRLPEVHPERVWVVEGIRWNGGTWTVSMPEAWAPVGDVRFPELYGHECEIVVRCYDRAGDVPASAGNG